MDRKGTPWTTERGDMVETIRLKVSEFNKTLRMMSAYHHLYMEVVGLLNRYGSMIDVAGIRDALNQISHAQIDYGRDIHEANDIY